MGVGIGGPWSVASESGRRPDGRTDGRVDGGTLTWSTLRPKMGFPVLDHLPQCPGGIEGTRSRTTPSNTYLLRTRHQGFYLSLYQIT